MSGRRPLQSVIARVALGAIAALSILAAPGLAAPKTSEVFPEFAQRRSSLGRVLLLADVVVVRQEGGTPVVRMARSHQFADSLMGLTRELLTAQGLAVDTAYLASMGITFNEERGFRIAEGDSGTAGTQLVNPPFLVDSALAATPDVEKRWKELNRTLRTYVRKKKDPPASLAQGAALAKALDAGAIAVLRVTSWDVPIGKQFGSFFSGGGNVQSSSSFIGLTVLANDGTILWDDWVTGASLKPEKLRDQTAKLAKNFP